MDIPSTQDVSTPVGSLSPNQSLVSTVPALTPSSSRSLSPSRSHVSTVSVNSTGSVSASPSYTHTFTIPLSWRPSIKSAIKNKRLNPDIRSELVRDLVTHMYGYMEQPTSGFCKFVAQRLILKYPFMRDSKGTGYVSCCALNRTSFPKTYNLIHTCCMPYC